MALRAAILVATSALLPMVAAAQPADLAIDPAQTTVFPPGVKVIRTADGRIYADRRGLVLYGMDLRTLLRWAPDASQYCKDTCATEWEPLMAPAGVAVNIRFPMGFGGQARVPNPGFVANQSAPDWTVIAGPQGPQWVYKGWHMVFTRRGSSRGVAADFSGDTRTWNTLKFRPPLPAISAPPQVSVAFVKDRYVLSGPADQVLVTGDCPGCAPLTAPLASSGIGQWQVMRSGDQPQWTWRGRPVFSAALDAVPLKAVILEPEAPR